MTKLNDLLSQLSTAAHELKKQVVAIDCSIMECQKQRDTLTSSPVSKADFLEYIRADIRRKYQGSRFMNTLKQRLGSVSREFGALEQMDKRVGNQNISYLTIDASSTETVKDEAVFFYFEDVILGRIASLVDGEAWPESAVPVEERKTLIVDLDAQIVALRQDRKKLTDQLLAAGLQG